MLGTEIPHAICIIGMRFGYVAIIAFPFGNGTVGYVKINLIATDVGEGTIKLPLHDVHKGGTFERLGNGL